MTSPWGRLAEMDDVTLVWTSDQAVLRGARARWFPGPRYIALDSSMRRLVARSSLAHELAHVVLDHPARCGNDFFDNRAEVEADQLAARWLIPDLRVLATELATTCNHGHAAANLRVSLDLFEARIHGLTSVERREVQRAVWSVHEGGGA